jgi:carbon monoxide dehydrogenase subunit G
MDITMDTGSQVPVNVFLKQIDRVPSSATLVSFAPCRKGGVFFRRGVMMEFAGVQDFSPAPAALWAKLSDARFLVECMPNAIVDVPPEAKKARFKVRPGFTFAHGTLDLTLEVIDAVAAQSVRILIAGKGIGSSSDVEINLALAAEGSGTRVHWKAEIKSLSGLLKAVPSGLIRGGAQQVIEDVLATVQEKLK